MAHRRPLITSPRRDTSCLGDGPEDEDYRSVQSPMLITSPKGTTSHLGDVSTDRRYLLTPSPMQSIQLATPRYEMEFEQDPRSHRTTPGDRMHRQPLPTTELPGLLSYSYDLVVPKADLSGIRDSYGNLRTGPSQYNRPPTTTDASHHRPDSQQEAYQYQTAPENTTNRESLNTTQPTSIFYDGLTLIGLDCLNCGTRLNRDELKWNMGYCTARRYDPRINCFKDYTYLFEKEISDTERKFGVWMSDASSIKCRNCPSHPEHDVRPRKTAIWTLERNNGRCLNPQCDADLRATTEYQWALVEVAFDQWIADRCRGLRPTPLEDAYWPLEHCR
ncbi:hypothetical protein B0J14DRAFT_689580 [Halenospora varia]|nr:hypothetical protein B0J14DRAFT_689580 [Halenospora varia]